MEDCNQNKQATFDPGWNDPPTSSYTAQQTTPNRPRNFLNKRVAFPLSGTGNSPTPQPVSLPSMPTTLPVFPPMHTNPKTSQVDETLQIDSENALCEVKTVLITLLENSSELGPKANDIRRRIDMMQEMWTSGKLNNTIHFQMQKLACALKDEQPSKADDIHRMLMVDHVNAVGLWMPGVKQLIHHCIARSELLSMDKE